MAIFTPIQQHIIVAGTNFPAAIGLDASQESAGEPLLDGNLVQGGVHYFPNALALEAASVKRFKPGQLAKIYADPDPLINCLWELNADMNVWTRFNDAGTDVEYQNDYVLQDGSIVTYDLINGDSAVWHISEGNKDLLVQPRNNRRTFNIDIIGVEGQIINFMAGAAGFVHIGHDFGPVSGIKLRTGGTTTLNGKLTQYQVDDQTIREVRWVFADFAMYEEENESFFVATIESETFNATLPMYIS